MGWRLQRGWSVVSLGLVLACADAGEDDDQGGSAESGNPPPGTSGTSAPTGDGDTTAASDDDDDDAVDTTAAAESSGGSRTIFDLPSSPDVGDDGPMVDMCTVQRDGAGVGECEETAPPDAFEPDVQWEWTGNPLAESYVTPLVANLTDDNGDGVVDLCDIPDVVVVATDGLFGASSRIVVLSGDDGTEHFTIPVDVNFTVTPAIADLDGNGTAEIISVTGTLGGLGFLVAFDNTGAMLWTSPSMPGVVDFGSPAVADLDGDGSVEIMMGGAVYDDMGTQLWSVNEDAAAGVASLVVPADLDRDGSMEVVHGARAYTADGEIFYDAPIGNGFPHIANFDDDDDPEIIVTNSDGINMLDHMGNPIWTGQTPTGDPAGSLTWVKPGTVHDFDGDGVAEFATGSANNYAVYEITNAGPEILWQAPVQDSSGSAGGTAFDFDGDGVAEAMYADETQLFIYDGAGNPLLTAPRESATGVEYPVVADIDNDGSAEIVVVSNTFLLGPGGDTPTVQAIRDVEDRWIQARRIWNQHTYHVSNVREDATIPTVADHSWLQLNTFRTNAQIENGGICNPRPEG